MFLIILLAVAIISQCIAAFVAIRLMRATKYNASWILITIALALLCFIMVNNLLGKLTRFFPNIFTFHIDEAVITWVIMIISLCFAIGVLLIQKILKYINLQAERRRREDERMMNAIIQAEENQRQKFAKELHDGLGPLLSSAKMSISALSQRVEGDLSKEIAYNIDQAITLSIKSIKEISNDLTPHVLGSFGIERALTSFINRLNPVTITKITIDSNLGTKRFDTKSELMVFRIVSELVNNTLKHADASILIIRLDYNNHEMAIELRDDGTGFDTSEPHDGMGLSNVTSRVGAVGGKIDIRSGIDEGTHITIYLPMRKIK